MPVREGPWQVNDWEGLQVAPDDNEHAPRATAESGQLEVYNESHKEAYNTTQKEAYEYGIPMARGNLDDRSGLETVTDGSVSERTLRNSGSLAKEELNQSPLQPARRTWWHRRRTLVVTAVLLLTLLAIAIPVGLIESKKSDDAALQKEAPSNVGSTTGAFNGTGVGSVIPLNQDGGSAFMYFQHFDGEIRQSTLASDGSWASSEETDTIVAAANAKNATPLAAAIYSNGTDAVRHIVWLDQSDVLQDTTQVNASGIWQPGQLGAAKFQASSSLTVGLAVGATQVAGQPGQPSTVLGNVQIYYGGVDHRVHLITLAANATTWEEAYVFPPNVNGNAGFAMAQPNNFTWFLYVDSHTNQLNYLYQQTFPQPDGNWQAGPSPAPATLRQNSSLSTAQFSIVAYQTPWGAIETIAFDSKNPTTPWGPRDSVGNGKPGTRLSASFMTSPVLIPTIWFQTGESDITMFQKPPGNTSFASTTVPVA